VEKAEDLVVVEKAEVLEKVVVEKAEVLEKVVIDLHATSM
jgi:hypothetical protein